MTADWEGGHPGEGTIHAWLDAELEARDAERLERHVQECPACAERVAEARGLMAGASRVIGQLDDPQPLAHPDAPRVLQSIATPVASPGSAWRILRVTPMRAAIAAALIVAVGITLTREHAAVDQPSGRDSVANMASAPAGSSGMIASAPTERTRDLPLPASPNTNRINSASPAAPGAASPPAQSAAAKAQPTVFAERVGGARDSVLSSAIARRLATEQPARTMEAAAGASAPTAAASVNAFARMDTGLSRQMRAGRAASAAAVVVAGAAAADKVATKPTTAMPADAGCYRFDAVDQPPTGWNGPPLPVDLALIETAGTPDASGAPRYAITAPAGGAQLGAWSRAAGDTLSIVLHGISVTTRGLLVPSPSGLVGTLRTAQAASPATPPGAAQLRVTTAVATQTVRIAAHRITCKP